MKSKKVQAQRKFAQGAIIPNGSASTPTPAVERRIEVPQPNIIYSSVSAKNLLDNVSFRDKHSHVPRIILRRLENEQFLTDYTPAAAPSGSSPAAASSASTLAAASSTSTALANYTVSTPTIAHSATTPAVAPKALKSSVPSKAAARQRLAPSRAQNDKVPMVYIPNRHSMRLRTKSPPKPPRELDKVAAHFRPSPLATVKKHQTRKIRIPKVQADSDIDDDKPLKYFITGKSSIVKPKAKGASDVIGDLSGQSLLGSRVNKPRTVTSTSRPRNGTPRPGTSMLRPGTSSSHPRTSTSRPRTITPRPGTSAPRSGTNTPRKETSTPRPEISTPRSETSMPRPGTSTPRPGTNTLRPGTSKPQHGTKASIHGTRSSNRVAQKKLPMKKIKKLNESSLSITKKQAVTLLKTRGPKLIPNRSRGLRGKPITPDTTSTAESGSIELIAGAILTTPFFETQVFVEKCSETPEQQVQDDIQETGHAQVVQQLQEVGHAQVAERLQEVGHAQVAEHACDVEHMPEAGHISEVGHLLEERHAEYMEHVLEEEPIHNLEHFTDPEHSDDEYGNRNSVLKYEDSPYLHIEPSEHSDRCDMLAEDDSELTEKTAVENSNQIGAVQRPCLMARYTTVKEVIEASESDLNWCTHSCKSCNRVDKARRLQDIVDVYEFKSELESPRESPRSFRSRQTRRVYESPMQNLPKNSANDISGMPRIVSVRSAAPVAEVAPAEEVTSDAGYSRASFTGCSDPMTSAPSLHNEENVSTYTAYVESEPSTTYPEAVPSTSNTYSEAVPSTSTANTEATSTASAPTDDKPVYLDCLPNNSSYIVQLTDLKRPMIRSRLVRKSQHDVTNEMSLVEHENILDKMLKNGSRGINKRIPPKKKKYTILINNTSDEDSEEEQQPYVRHNRRRTLRGSAPAPVTEPGSLAAPAPDTATGPATASAPSTEPDSAPAAQETTPSSKQERANAAVRNVATTASAPTADPATEPTTVPVAPTAADTTEPARSQSPSTTGYNTRGKPARRTARATSDNSDLLENGILSLRTACDLIEAPVFHPTLEEFQDPVAYFDKLAPKFAKFGLCKVVPPEGFAPPCHLTEDIRFTVQNQYISRMYSRWGPAAREMCAIKARASSQSVVFIRSPLFEGLEVNLPKLFHLVQKNGGLKRVMERQRWGRIAEEMQFSRVTNAAKRVDQLYVKYVVPYDLLSTEERNDIMATVECRWTKRNQKMLERAMKPLHQVKQLMCESESSADESEEPNDFYTMAIREAEDCVSNGRLLSLVSFKKIAANAMATYFPMRHENIPTTNKSSTNTAKTNPPANNTPSISALAPDTATPANSTSSSKKPLPKKPAAKNDSTSPPTTGEIEREYWRLMWMAMDHVCINGASIDTGSEGYGFPRRKDEPYSHHPWNLKMVSKNPRNVLGALGLVLGVTVPTLHLGMVFSTSCWHRDPHGLPWIEYLHTGPNKIWYGIPDEQSDVFRAAVEALCPTSCQRKTIWLPSDITMIPPNLLCEHNVRLTRVVQKPGEYIIVHPKAYSSSICTGYTISESVYFASDTWLDDVAQVFQVVRDSCEPTMFPLEQLLIALLKDQRQPPHVLRKVLPLLQTLVTEELTLRYSMSAQLQLVTEDELPNTSQQKRGRLSRASKVYNAWNVCDLAECDACRTTLYMTRVVDLNQRNSNLCLMHASRLLPKLPPPLPPTAAIVTIYSNAELKEILADADAKLQEIKLT